MKKYQRPQVEEIYNDLVEDVILTSISVNDGIAGFDDIYEVC